MISFMCEVLSVMMIIGIVNITSGWLPQVGFTEREWARRQLRLATDTICQSDKRIKAFFSFSLQLI